MDRVANSGTLHVYNARCALTVEPVRNRRGDLHTVNLELAVRVGSAFDWRDKSVLQVGREELVDVLATVLGWRDAVEFAHHGERRDKGYRMRRDGARLVVQLYGGGHERRTVALATADRLAFGALLFAQIRRNHATIDEGVLYAMLETLCRPATATDEATDTRGPALPKGTAAAARRAVPSAPDEARDAAAGGAAQEPDPYGW